MASEKKENQLANHLEKSGDEKFIDNRLSSEIGKEYFDEIIKIVSSWQKIRLITISKNLVLEIEGQFPAGSYGRGYYNFHSKESPIGGHLKEGVVANMQLATKVIHGKRSYSINFNGLNGKSIFKVFLGRDEEGKIFTNQLEDFYSLFEKYGKN